MGFSLILRAFFSFPNERQFIECQFFWKFREILPETDAGSKPTSPSNVQELLNFLFGEESI